MSSYLVMSTLLQAKDVNVGIYDNEDRDISINLKMNHNE